MQKKKNDYQDFSKPTGGCTSYSDPHFWKANIMRSLVGRQREEKTHAIQRKNLKITTNFSKKKLEMKNMITL